MATTNETANVGIYLTTDEANRKLKELKLSAIDLKEKLDQMGKGSPERKQAQLQLRQLKNEIKGVQDSLNKKVDLVINGNMAGASIRDLQEASRKLWNEIRKLAPETQEFINKSKQLQQVEGRLKSLQAEAKGTSGFFSGMKKELKAFGVMALGFLGFQALASQIQNVISKNAQLSDSMADVQKTTGMTKREVADLNNELGKMNTRSSRQELLKLAADAGKLGIAGKENVLGFVRAADKINVALGEDLGEDAIKNIGKLNDLFKVRDAYGYENGMLKIGSAINALGQASTASEGYLVDFTKRLGGIASQTKISIENILGLGATLDSLGQQSETASTAVGMLLVDMFKNTGDYAKIAGKDVKEFSELLKTDANEAFLQVLEGLNGNNDGFAIMAQKLKDVGVEGARGTAVLSTLSGNVKLLRGQQALSNDEFRKGTSIMNEFNTKNETFGAKWEKLMKKIYGSFSNSSMTSALEGIVDFLNKVSDSTPTMDRLTQEFNKQKTAVESYQKNIVPLIARYDELKAKSSLTKDEQGELKKVIDLIARSIPTAITEFDKYGKALDISSEKAKLFGQNLRNLMEVKNADALKESRSALYDIRKEIEAAQKALANRDLNGDIVKTVSVTKKVAGEFETYTKEVKLTAAQIENLQAKLLELNNTQTGIELNINELSGTQLYKPNDQTQTINQVVTPAVDPGASNNPSEIDEKFISKTKELTRQLEDIKIAAIEDEEKREQAALSAKLERQKQEVTNAEADAKVKKDLLLALEEEYQAQSKALTVKYTEEKNIEAYDRDVNNLNAWHQTKQLLLLEQLNRGELTDQEYKDKLKLQESNFLQERKKLAVDYGKDVVDIEKQIQEDIRNEQENTINTERTNRKAQLDFNLQYAKAGTKEELNARIAILTDQLYQELANTNFTAEEKKIIWQAYYDTVGQMNQDFIAGQMQQAKQYVDAFMNIFSSISTLMSNDADRELAKDKKINEEKKRNLKNQLDSKRISESKYRSEIEKLDNAHAAKVAKVKREQFKRDKVAKTIQAIINTAVGVTAALTLPPPAGYILAALTAAAGALEIAAISSAAEPEFEKGRKPTNGIVKGPSHSQQGIKLLDAQTGKVVGEMEGDEGIFSKKMYANNRDIIDAIFDAKGDPVISNNTIPSLAAPATISSGQSLEPVPDLRVGSDLERQITPGLVNQGEEASLENKQNPNRVAAEVTESAEIPDTKQANPNRAADPIFQAGRFLSSTLSVEQLTGIKIKSEKLLESQNIIEQNEALKQFREYTEEVVNIYKDKTEVINAIENNKKTVSSEVSVENISKNQNLEFSINEVDRAITEISDRKVLAFQQVEYFKRASYLISQADDGLLPKETLQASMKVLEKRLIDRMVDQDPVVPGIANRDTSGTILNPELDLRTLTSRTANQEPQLSNPTLSIPTEPQWVNQAVPQLNTDRIIENIRMEESIKTLLIVEQLKKEFPALEGADKINPVEYAVPQPSDQLTPVLMQLSEVLTDIKSKGVKGVWEHRSFSEGLEQIEEIQAKARF